MYLYRYRNIAPPQNIDYRIKFKKYVIAHHYCVACEGCRPLPDFPPCCCPAVSLHHLSPRTFFRLPHSQLQFGLRWLYCLLAPTLTSSCWGTTFTSKVSANEEWTVCHPGVYIYGCTWWASANGFCIYTMSQGEKPSIALNASISLPWNLNLKGNNLGPVAHCKEEGHGAQGQSSWSALQT